MEFFLLSFAYLKSLFLAFSCSNIGVREIFRELAISATCSWPENRRAGRPTSARVSQCVFEVARKMPYQHALVICVIGEVAPEHGCWIEATTATDVHVHGKHLVAKLAPIPIRIPLVLHRSSHG